MLSSMRFQQLGFKELLPKKPVASGTPVVSGDMEGGDGTTGVGSANLESRAKTEAQNQLASKFPQTVTDKRYANSSYVNVTIDGKDFHVTATPKYIHNINEGTYSLQSIEYKVEEGNWESTCPNDYNNNIIENKAIGTDTNIDDLKNELSALGEKINTKLGELEKWQNKISKNGLDFGVDGNLFEVDENSPDVASDLANKIEQATKLLNDLETKVNAKQQEYYYKRESVSNLKQQAQQLDEEYATAMKLLDDLCEHYGVDNNKNLKIAVMETPETNDLETVMEYYHNYISMQKENIANINAEIDKIKNPSSDDNAKDDNSNNKGTLPPNLDMDKIKNLLKNFATRKVYEK